MAKKPGGKGKAKKDKVAKGKSKKDIPGSIDDVFNAPNVSIEDTVVTEAKSKAKKQPEIDNKIPRPYCIGTIDESPFQNIAIGGVMFHRYIEKLERGPEPMEVSRSKKKGGIVYLTDAELVTLKARVDKIVFRIYGKTGRGLRASKMDKTDINYRKSTRDLPASKFVYIRPLDAALPHNWRDEVPVPLAV